MNYYEDVHRRAEELARTWCEDPKLREETLKEIILKELHTKAYWYFIKLDKQETKTSAPVQEEPCLCNKLKKFFKQSV